jgi:sulfite exporter TauE/SafE
VAYNLGRILTYCLLGALFGLLGLTFALAGLQRWVSLAAGLAVLLIFAGSSWGRWPGLPITRLVASLKSALAKLLRRRTLGSLLCLGVLNGLLPCGLVYTACAGAVAAGGSWRGAQYMLVFGLGTVPMLLGITLAGKQLQPTLRLRFQRLVPVTVVLLGLLLVLRGLALNIPYLSPDLSNPAHALLCH